MSLSRSYIEADVSVPVMESTVGSVLREAAEMDCDGIGLVSCDTNLDESRRWRFSELLGHAESVAHALLARFDPGDHVAVWAPNVPEWILLQFGMGLAGLVMVPLNPAYRRPELAYALQQSKAAGIFYSPEYRGSPMAQWVQASRDECPGLREAIELSDWKEFCASGSAQQKLPDVSPLDPAQIQYTSGTTGAPKGATLHHRGLTNNGRFVVSSLGARPGEAYLNPAPLFHVAGCVVGVLGALACRATLVQSVSFEPGLALSLC
jgi:fatty-acyl-CoA synthase